MRKVNPQRAEIIEYIRSHPEQAAGGIARRYRVPPKYIYNLKHDYVTNAPHADNGKALGIVAATKPTAIKPTPKATCIMRLAAEVPADGLELKLTHGSRMLGTLLILPEGIQFAISNQKKRPGRTLSFAVLKSLMDIGFIQ